MPKTDRRRARRQVERASDEEIAQFAAASALSFDEAQARIAAHRHTLAMARLRAKGWHA